MHIRRSPNLESNDRLDAEPIIDGLSEVLLAAQVLLRGLHRYMSEQELDLLQFTP
jgi:hypothetical protein